MRLNAAALAVAAVGTLGVSSFLLIDDVVNSSGPRLNEIGLASPLQSSPLRPNFYIAAKNRWWSPLGQNPFEDRPSLSLQLTGVGVQDRVLKTRAQFFFPKALRDSLYVSLPGFRSTPVADPGEDRDSPRLKEEYADEVVKVVMRVSSSSAELDVSSVTLKDLFKPFSKASEVFSDKTIDLPMSDWESASYPNDWYVFGAAAIVMAEPPLAVDMVSSRLAAWPLGLMVTAGGDLRSYRVSMLTVRNNAPTEWRPEVGILVQRDTGTIAYVYTMALIPVGFALVVLHQLFLLPQKKPAHDMAATILAAILTVLPLRQVLVPSTIEGLTRVDLILGFGLSLVLCLTFTRHAIDQWREAVTGGQDPTGPAQRIQPRFE